MCVIMRRVPLSIAVATSLVAPAVSCTSLLGIDHDYRAASGDETSAEAGIGAPQPGDGAAESAPTADTDASPPSSSDASPADAPIADAAEPFPADPGSVVKVVAGKFHTCALFSSGFAKCWGRNDDFLELGNGTSASTAVPLPSMLRGGLLDLFAGAHETCATVAGGAVCAGRGDQGQLANGADAGSAVPVTVTAFPSAPISIASGDAFTCALLGGGEVWCVGDGLRGELGDGAFHVSATAVRAQLGGAAQAIAAFNTHACALRTDGTVECWGDNSSGQLGNGSTLSDAGVSQPAPVSGISGAVAVGVGAAHSCALLGGASQGSVWCWGDNGYGQLGDGTTAPRASPVKVMGLSGATSLAVGGAHACAGLFTAGIVQCWGKGGSGELGNGKAGNAPVPVMVRGISYPESLAAGAFHTCALVSSPNVVCWGSNDFGQLGNGDAPNAQTQPAQVTW